MLEQAKRNLREELVFFGLTERFDESLVLAKRRLGFRSILYRTSGRVEHRPRRAATRSPTSCSRPPGVQPLRHRALRYAQELFDDAPERSGARLPGRARRPARGQGRRRDRRRGAAARRLRRRRARPGGCCSRRERSYCGWSSSSRASAFLAAARLPPRAGRGRRSGSADAAAGSGATRSRSRSSTAAADCERRSRESGSRSPDRPRGVEAQPQDGRARSEAEAEARPKGEARPRRREAAPLKRAQAAAAASTRRADAASMAKDGRRGRRRPAASLAREPRAEAPAPAPGAEPSSAPSRTRRRRNGRRGSDHDGSGATGRRPRRRSSGGAATVAGSIARRLRVIEPPAPGIRRTRGRRYWHYRAAFPFFVRRFLSKRYGRTFLGMIWLFLPVAPAAVHGRASSSAASSASSIPGVPYFLYFIVASRAWHLFSQTAYLATRSLEISRSEHPPRLRAAADPPDRLDDAPGVHLPDLRGDRRVRGRLLRPDAAASSISSSARRRCWSRSRW